MNEQCNSDDANTASVFAGFESATDVPGAVSMVWTGTEMLTDVCGYADLEKKKPMTADSLFWIASNTKAIACALALKCVDRGEIDLDAPVAKYIPEWEGIKLADGRSPSHAPVVREIMGHTAGLAFFPEMPISKWSVQELAVKAARDGLDHDVGEYVYSNWGIDVTMAIVERVKGRPWEVLLQEEVLDPLEMDDTTFFPSPELCERRLATTYHYDPENQTPPLQPTTVDQLVWPYDRPGTKAEAGGGLFSTAADVMKFFRMVAARGVSVGGKRFISEKLMDEWYGLTDFYNGKRYTFGMDAYRDKGVVGHGGAYNTFGEANWKRGTAAVFMVQTWNPSERAWARRQKWEDFVSQWIGIGADKNA